MRINEGRMFKLINVIVLLQKNPLGSILGKILGRTFNQNGDN